MIRHLLIAGLLALAPLPALAQDTGVLFWPPERREVQFRAMEAVVPHVSVPPSPVPRVLPTGRPLQLDPAAFMQDQRTAGLLVIQNGQIRLERYGLDLKPDDHWTSFSVTKSITSLLFGAAVKDGLIDPDAPVTRYLPEMAGGAYDGVTVDQLLTMTSGVDWNEDYTDPNADVVRIFANPPVSALDPTVAYLNALPRANPPGEQWRYNTGETNLVGVLLRRAVGRPLGAYLYDKVWSPAGMEAPAFWMLDARGEAVGGCCLSATLRDWGRLALFSLDGWGGAASTLPADWMRQSSRPLADIGVPGRGYGRMWWTFEDGTYQARGIFGQTLHVDPQRDLIVVILSAWPQATSDAASVARAGLIRSITEAVDAEGAPSP